MGGDFDCGGWEGGRLGIFSCWRLVSPPGLSDDVGHLVDLRLGAAESTEL